jgi:seryl-tRNA synthetase
MQASIFSEEPEISEQDTKTKTSGKRMPPPLLKQVIKLKQQNLRLRKKVKEMQDKIKELSQTTGLYTLAQAAKTFYRKSSAKTRAESKKRKQGSRSVWDDIF